MAAMTDRYEVRIPEGLAERAALRARQLGYNTLGEYIREQIRKLAAAAPE